MIPAVLLCLVLSSVSSNMNKNQLEVDVRESYLEVENHLWEIVKGQAEKTEKPKHLLKKIYSAHKTFVNNFLLDDFMPVNVQKKLKVIDKYKWLAYQDPMETTHSIYKVFKNVLAEEYLNFDEEFKTVMDINVTMRNEIGKLYNLIDLDISAYQKQLCKIEASILVQAFG